MKPNPRRILLRLAKATEEIEKLTMAGGAKAIHEAAHRLADDPRQPDYVVRMMRAMIRGMASARAGLSPGETVQKEWERKPD